MKRRSKNDATGHSFRRVALQTISVRRSGMRLSCFVLVCSAVVLLSGCVTGDVKYVVPLADGTQLNVPMTREGPPPGQAEGYRIVRGALQPGEAERTAYYEFDIVAEQEPALRRIQIIDLSDEAPIPLVDDQNPQFTNRRWTGKSETMTADDRRLKFIFQITFSLRVYRVVLTANDGHQITFNHIATYPPFFKQAIRGKWGEKY